ncbi:MAG: ADOP family duplicated permease [Acidobacteriaceae bacterium]
MAWLGRIRSLFRREVLGRELEEEFRFHLDMREQRNVAEGMSPEEARRAARLRFGNPVTVRERTMGVLAALAVEGLWRDLRYALRRMRRSPGFCVTAVVTLGLGIGANLAVFRLLYSVVYAPLPVVRPGELVALHAVESPFDGQWFVSYPAYERLRQATGAAAPVIARTGFGMGLLQMPGKAAEQAGVDARFQLVSDNFFSVLGVQAAAGRLFSTIDGRLDPGEWPVVLRYGYALRQFGTAQVAGRHAVLNGMPVVIVGVAERRFLGVVTGYAPDLWLPLQAESSGRAGAWFDSLGPGHGIHLDDSWLEQPGIFWLWVTARAPANQRTAAAARWTAALQPDLALMADAARTPEAKTAILRARVRLIPDGAGEGTLGNDSRLPLALLMGLAGAVFLAGCLNLANLQAARLNAWQRDFSVRMALGAERWRLLRPIVTEDVLLMLGGGVLAVLTGRIASVVLVRWASSRDWLLDLNLYSGPRVLLLAGGLMLVALCVFSVLPAWHSVRGPTSGSIGAKRMQAGAAQSAGARRWSNAMLAMQVSFSLLLVAMAACFARTLVDLNHINTGMDREHVLSVHVDLVHGYAEEHKNLPVLYRTLTKRLDALPDVRGAAVAMCRIPFCGWNTALHAFGRPDTGAHGEENHIGPGYFRALGVPLLRGRDFSDADGTDTEKVAILNEAYAKKLFGSENPLGHWIGYERTPHDHEFLVVGEVADTRVDGPQWAAPPVVYLSVDQNPAPIHSIEVRTAGPAEDALAEVREALRAFDPRLPVTDMVSLGTEMDDGLTQQKLLARLTGVLAGLTLAMAALGFYGVMWYRVTQRRSEIGVRMALGATCGQVQGLVLRQTLAVMAAGLAPGLLLTVMATHAARSLLVGAGSSAWLALVASVAVMTAVGAVATLVPAWRASKVDPMEALRWE